MGRQEKGFTILEVVLFLAISSLLFAMIFSTINGTLRGARFSASVKSLGEYLKSEFVSVQTGGYMKDFTGLTTSSVTCSPTGVPALNPTGTGQGQSDTCLAVGVLLDLGNPVAGSSTITSYPLLAYSTKTDGLSTAQALAQSNIQVFSSGGTDSYTLDWGGKLTAAKKLITANISGLSPDRSSAIRYLAIVRDVNSEAINIFSYADGADPFSGTVFNSPAHVITQDYTASLTGNGVSPYRNEPVLLCFSSDDASVDMRGMTLVRGNGTGRGLNVGSISTKAEDKNAPQFTDIMTVQPFSAYSAGYGGMPCGN